jgi:hypothetical protein
MRAIRPILPTLTYPTVIVPYVGLRPPRGVISSPTNPRLRLAFKDNKRRLRTFGALGINQAEQSVASDASMGATAGSIVPGIGSAIGAAAGAVIGVVSNLLGSKPNTAAHLPWAGQLASAISGMTVSPGIGRQIQWNQDTPGNMGLAQMVEAILATGLWMNWDPSLISNYDVCAHWATTFQTAVQVVVTAICKNPVNAMVNCTIDNEPGGQNINSQTFTFKNPGYQVGCQVISQNIIMGNSGLMYHMIIQTGETAAHASANANNSPAQKVFALIADYVIAQNTPSVQTAPPAAYASVPVVTPVAGPRPVLVTGTTSAGTPVVAPSDTDALIQQLIAQGNSQNQAIAAALQSLAANGIDTSQPQIQQQVAASAASAFGLSDTDWLLIAGATVIGLFFFMESKK